LIDSGATGNFIDTQVASANGFKALRKTEAYTLNVIDGEQIGSNKGMVTHETELLNMRILKGHTEEIQFDLVAMGTHAVILGMPWLREHNPHIDWWRERITMSQCRCPSDGTTPSGNQRGSGQRQLCATTLSPEDQAQASVLKQIPAAYKEYEFLFREGPRNEALPKHQPWDHEIPIVPGKEPTFGPIYPHSERELAELKSYIDTNLEKGFIRPSTSPAASPTLFVPKKNGKLRLCVDYRQLNSITIKDRYPLPLINELHDRLRGAQWFTTMDMRGAYNLVRIKEGHEWKTAFRTRYGLYEYTVMPFGLTNAPASFQRLVNNVLHEYLDIFAVAYLDDILIYSKTKEEHTKHVLKVLAKLAERKLLLDPEKCEFYKEEVTFLGFMCGRNGIRMDPAKIEAVTNWKEPTTVKEVQAFLGFANFYRRFIKGFSAVTQPLTMLTRKEQKWEWTDKAQEAFDTLKECFTSAPILTTFDPERPIVLETDASDFAIGACLSQLDDDKRLKPIAYYSRKLSPAELNYDVHDKELLAIVVAFEQWRVYLEGPKHQVQVWTDHKNLTSFTTTKILNRRQVRWSEMLSAYNFTISYRKGSENARADALSRQQEYSGKPTERPRAILKQGHEGMEYNHELLATISIVENKELEQQIKDAYPLDECAARVLKQPTHDFALDQQGILRFKGLVYIPSRIRTAFIQEQHSLPAHGHQGIAKTFERLARDYYFPEMRKKVEKIVSECDLCNKSKASRHSPYGLIRSPPVPGRAWKSIAFDFVVKLPPSREPMTKVVYDSIWVVTDRTTKYGHFVPYKEASDAKELAYAFLRHVVSQHGLPDEIISDRDKLFTSKFWTSLMAQLGANHKLSTAFHPQTDGQTERLNQTLEQYLRCYVNYQQNNWVELLPVAELAYNTARSDPIGTSPFFANYGYEPELYKQPRKDNVAAQAATVAVNDLQKLQQQMARDLEFLGLRTAVYANKKRSVEPTLKKGDRVYLLRKNIKTKRPSTKLDFKKLGPYEVEEKIGPVNYQLKLPQGSRLHPVFHISLLEPTKGPTPVATSEDIQPENDPDVYEVEKIVRTRVVRDQRQYLVKWEGYDDSENSWELTEDISPGLLKEFHQSQHPGNLRQGESGPRGQKKHRLPRTQDRGDPSQHRGGTTPTRKQETKTLGKQ
jgi:RNase H-like domain found in reverse transcriptase/Reverse transcriptase (RNA-dependent DNA polymerase)/Integrase zinc binding domain/Chromo (CHRromatin Organisation MOdifier) domain